MKVSACSVFGRPICTEIWVSSALAYLIEANGEHFVFAVHLVEERLVHLGGVLLWVEAECLAGDVLRVRHDDAVLPRCVLHDLRNALNETVVCKSFRILALSNSLRLVGTNIADPKGFYCL